MDSNAEFYILLGIAVIGFLWWIIAQYCAVYLDKHDDLSIGKRTLCHIGALPVYIFMWLYHAVIIFPILLICQCITAAFKFLKFIFIRPVSFLKNVLSKKRMKDTNNDYETQMRDLIARYRQIREELKKIPVDDIKAYYDAGAISASQYRTIVSAYNEKVHELRQIRDQVDRLNSTPGKPKNNIASGNKKSGKTAVVLFLSVAVLFVGFTAWSLIDSNSNSTPIETTFSNPPKSSASTTPQEPKPVTEPNTGYIFEGGWDDGSELTITAPYNASVVVKAKNIYGSTEICFYVQAGDTVTMDVPAEDLQIFFASGSKWYGYDDLFGSFTSYSKDDSYLDFCEYTWSYTLRPVTDGNFSETPSSKSEFME